MQIELKNMNPTFVTLVAAVSTRDQVPFDKAIVIAGNLLANRTKKKEAK